MKPRGFRSREAVALAYGDRAAPVVTAKGRDELAEAIPPYYTKHIGWHMLDMFGEEFQQ